MHHALARCLLAALLALGTATAPHVRAADAPIVLDWVDLIPPEAGVLPGTLRSLGIVQHGEMTVAPGAEAGSAVTSAFNGRLVKLPGFVVPLDWDGEGTRTFLLVPYVGACIHVPPPPPNQLVLVTSERPYPLASLFEPVWVTGLFGTAAMTTELAEVGYALSAERIDPYE